MNEEKKAKPEKPFELFGGCLGNGVTVCNKAVIERGDYKIIAHISNKGEIEWYIKNPETYVPEEDMEKIHGWAYSARKTFLDEWEKMSDIRKYEVILDEIPTRSLLELDRPVQEQLKSCTDLHEKVKILEKIYFARKNRRGGKM